MLRFWLFLDRSSAILAVGGFDPPAGQTRVTGLWYGREQLEHKAGGNPVAIGPERLGQADGASSPSTVFFNKINEVAEGMGFEPTIRD
jgi:hypothetical protein